MYDIKHEILLFSILSVPLFIITGGHAIIAMLFLGVLPYHIYCNAQEKKRREEKYQLALKHSREEAARLRPYVVSMYKRRMRTGDLSGVPVKEREYIRKLVEEDMAREAAFKAKQQAQHISIRRPECEYKPPNIAELNRKIDSMRH